MCIRDRFGKPRGGEAARAKTQGARFGKPRGGDGQAEENSIVSRCRRFVLHHGLDLSLTAEREIGKISEIDKQEINKE